jgi:hypothetical protein
MASLRKTEDNINNWQGCFGTGFGQLGSTLQHLPTGVSFLRHTTLSFLPFPFVLSITGIHQFRVQLIKPITGTGMLFSD